MESTPESETVVHEFVERLNDHDWDGLDALLGDGFTVTVSGGEHDREAFLDSERAFAAVFPDLTYDLAQVFAADDRVGFRWTFTGTHTGEGGPGVVGEVEPTGESVDGAGIQLARIEDGRIAALWAEWSGLSLYDQLGLVEWRGRTE